MKIEFDPGLVEQAVFLKAREDICCDDWLHRITDPLYKMAPGPEREAKFSKIYGQAFTEMGLDAPIWKLLAEQPLLEERVGLCLVHAAAGRRKEGADLLVKRTENPTASPSVRTLVLQILPETLLFFDRRFAYLRRELYHVADMLDERFQYRREFLEGFAARQNLVRDRYRVLWDVAIEGRLARRGQSSENDRTRLRRLFAKLFSGPLGNHTDPAFDRIVNAENLNHPQLIDCARSPRNLFGSPEGKSSPADRQGGGSCPLCGFPTFDWFDCESVEGRETARAIASTRPGWSPSRGICRQCADLYRAAHEVAAPQAI